MCANVKGAICRIWPTIKFTLKANREQHMTGVTANCSFCKLKSSVSHAASSSDWDLRDQGSIIVYTSSTGAFEQDRSVLAAIMLT